MVYRTRTEQQTAQRRELILTRYRQLRKANPDAKKCRIMAQIASEDYGVNTMQGVRNIIIKAGLYD